VVLRFAHGPAPGLLGAARIKEGNDLTPDTVAAAAADQRPRVAATIPTTAEALRAFFASQGA
jgi:hypothetical protein